MSMQITETSQDYKVPIEVIPLTQYFEEVADPKLGEVLGDHKMFREKKIIISQDRDRLFSVASSKTPVIRHSEAIENVYGAIDKIYGEPPVVDVTSLHEGASIMAKFELPVPEMVNFTPEDQSTISIVLMNSYSRQFSFKIKTGLFRMVCSNGMIVGDEIASLNSRQVMSSGLTPDSLSPNIERLIYRTKQIERFWEKWKNVEIPASIAIELIESKLSKKLYASLLNEARYPMTLWEFYNELTFKSTHETATYHAQVMTDMTISRLFYSGKSIIRKLDSMDADLVHMKEVNKLNSPNEDTPETKH